MALRAGLAFVAGVALCAAPATAGAWGYKAHQVIATMARDYLTPQVRARVDEILAADTDNLTAHDMAAEATWADAYRGAGHRETASWHFVDLELGHPDLQSACFGFPTAASPASAGPAQDCLIDKLEGHCQSNCTEAGFATASTLISGSGSSVLVET